MEYDGFSAENDAQAISGLADSAAYLLQVNGDTTRGGSPLVFGSQEQVIVGRVAMKLLRLAETLCDRMQQRIGAPSAGEG